MPLVGIRGEHMLRRLRDTVVRAHKLGVAIVTGGDTGYGPNSLTRIGQEVTHFTEMGFTPLDALQSATIRIFRIHCWSSATAASASIG
jgi:imidazolonepropionase-like amidohydrolase